MKQTNAYIFLYSSIMVIVVAAILSFAAMALKPFQDKSIEIEKKKYILTSAQLAQDLDNATNKDKSNFLIGSILLWIYNEINEISSLSSLMYY